MKILPKLLFAALLFLGVAHGLYIDPDTGLNNAEPTGHNQTAFGGCTRVSVLPLVSSSHANLPAGSGI